MLRPYWFSLLLASIASMLICASSQPLAAQEKKPPKVTYDDHVKPVLRQKCFTCHNPDKKSGDLDLTNYTNLMQGGASGPVIEPGDAASSYLYMLITHESEPFMPPESPKMPDEMIETVRKWIDGGVLENTGSKALGSKKKKFDLALSTTPTERPEVIPMPGRHSLAPVNVAPRGTSVTAMATSPWAPLAAVAGFEQVSLYDTKNQQLLGVFPFPEGTPYVLKFSRSGSLLLAGGGRGGASGKVVVWDIRSGERVIEVGDELDAVLAADMSSDQALIALGGPQRVVRIYSTETGEKLHEIRKHTDWITSLEFSPDSVLLATGDRNGGLHVWEAYTAREYLTLKAHSGMITGTSWRLDSNILASSSLDGSVRLWELENGNQVKNWTAHGGGVESLEFARDGRVLTSGRDRVAKLWKQDGGQIRAFPPAADLAVQVSFCDETDAAIVGDWTGSVRVFAVADGKPVGELRPHPPKLATRLEEANQQLAEQRKTTESLLNQFNAKSKAAAELSANYQKLEATLAAATAKKAQFDKSMVATGEALKASQARLTQATNAVGQLAPVVPGLQASLATAREAIAKSKTDQGLTQFLAGFEKLVAERAQTLETMKANQSQAQADVAKQTEQVKSLQTELATLAKGIAAYQGDMAKLKPQLDAALKAASEAKPSADQAAAALAQAEAAVKRWQDEIQFAGQLAEIRKQRAELIAQRGQAEIQLAEAQQQAQATEQMVSAARGDLEQQQKVMSEFMAQHADGTQKMQQVVAQAEKHQQSIAQLTQRIEVLNGAIASLEAAVQKTQQAADAAKDEAIKKAAEQLASVVSDKQKELQSAMQEMQAHQKMMVAAQAEASQMQTMLQQLQEKMEAQQKQIATCTQKVESAQSELAADQQMVTGLQKAFDDLLARVEANRQQQAKLQGLDS